jgi:hypothetical protein
MQTPSDQVGLDFAPHRRHRFLMQSPQDAQAIAA